METKKLNPYYKITTYSVTNTNTQRPKKYRTNTNVKTNINKLQKKMNLDNLYLYNINNAGNNLSSNINNNYYNYTHMTPKTQLNTVSYDITSKNPLTDNNSKELNRTQKYINYLKQHLDSSYYANNELKNKNEFINNKLKDVNSEIVKSQNLIQNLNNSLNEKIYQNNHYKELLNNFLTNNFFGTSNKNDNIQKINELIKQNKILEKEIKSKEEIIKHLKKTMGFLEKQEKSNISESMKNFQEFKEEYELLLKTKNNTNKLIQDLREKNIKMEESKKSILYLLKNNEKNTNNSNKESLNDLLIEINNSKKEFEKKNLVLNEIKQKLNEFQTQVENFKNKEKNSGKNIKELILNEEKKNKELLININKSNDEAKGLAALHKTIKNKYGNIIDKLRDDIENLPNKKKEFTEEEKMTINKLLLEQETLKKFNEEFKQKAILKNILNEKMLLLKKENENLKQKIMFKNTTSAIEEQPSEFEKTVEDKLFPKSSTRNNNNDLCLYTITNTGKLFSYNITKKIFTIINTNLIENFETFKEIFLSNYDGSLFLNTLKGLYILTGKEYKDLYYYCPNNNNISKKKILNSGHKNGGLIYYDKNKILALGGESSNETELINFENDSITLLSSLNNKRINSSYSLINEKLYAIFGNENDTIEFLEIGKNTEWKIFENIEISEQKNIFGHASVPINDNEILIIGGKNNDKMMIFNINEKTVDIMSDVQIPFIDTVGEYVFDKDKWFNVINNENDNDNEENQLICMDSMGNVHSFDNSASDFTYVVLLIEKQDICSGENNENN